MNQTIMQSFYQTWCIIGLMGLVQVYFGLPTSENQLPSYHSQDPCIQAVSNQWSCHWDSGWMRTTSSRLTSSRQLTASWRPTKIQTVKANMALRNWVVIEGLKAWIKCKLVSFISCDISKIMMFQLNSIRLCSHGPIKCAIPKSRIQFCRHRLMQEEEKECKRRKVYSQTTHTWMVL